MISLTCSSVKTFGSTLNGILQHRHRGHVLALLRGQGAIGHRRQPNVGVETDLMTGMAGEHGSAARLRHVADQEPRPAVERAGVARQPLEIIEQARRAPIAVARHPHHLPIRSVDRQRHAAGETAFGVAADRAGGERRGLGHAPNNSLAGGPLGRRRLLAAWRPACRQAWPPPIWTPRRGSSSAPRRRRHTTAQREAQDQPSHP